MALLESNSFLHYAEINDLTNRSTTTMMPILCNDKMQNKLNRW